MSSCMAEEKIPVSELKKSLDWLFAELEKEREEANLAKKGKGYYRNVEDPVDFAFRRCKTLVEEAFKDIL